MSAIKTKYDPNGIFWVSPGINVDHFAVQNGRVCRIAAAQQTSYAQLAPETDNRNPASSVDSNADGPGFPLLWDNGRIVEVPNGGKPKGNERLKALLYHSIFSVCKYVFDDMTAQS